MDRSLVWIAAVVAFVVAIVLCFVGNVSVKDILALIAAGLACLAIANATPLGR